MKTRTNQEQIRAYVRTIPHKWLHKLCNGHGWYNIHSNRSRVANVCYQTFLQSHDVKSADLKSGVKRPYLWEPPPKRKNRMEWGLATLEATQCNHADQSILQTGHPKICVTRNIHSLREYFTRIAIVNRTPTLQYTVECLHDSVIKLLPCTDILSSFSHCIENEVLNIFHLTIFSKKKNIIF